MALTSEQKKAYNRAYYQAHKPEPKRNASTITKQEYNRRYYQAHKEPKQIVTNIIKMTDEDRKLAKKMYNKRYYENHPTHQKNYRLAHKEEIKKRNHEYYLAHKK